ncbi:MAG: M2 family metallopeptidase [Myxococcota bacterium]
MHKHLPAALLVVLTSGCGSKAPQTPATPRADVAVVSAPTAAPPTAPATPATAPTPGPTGPSGEPKPGPAAAPTADDAKRFIDDANAALHKLHARAETAEFIKNTYITSDTERNAASAQSDMMEYLSTAIPMAATFRDTPTDAVTRRALTLLRVSPTLPAPADPRLRDELANISAKLEGHYGEAKACKKDPKTGAETCRDLQELTHVLQTSKDFGELTEAWTGWHATAAESRKPYERLVELGNQGARELGFSDMGDLWRSGYDMPPADFEAEIERLWQQVRPLYEKLHCYARQRLSAAWGADKVPAEGPIPAQVMGNMWAQDWSSLYPVLEPYKGAASLDLTKALKAKKVDAKGVVKYAEGFFTSLGLPSLPPTFWERSMLTKPRDREVVCHASAWDVTYDGDVRIKVCIEVNDDDFVTIHHELGHIYYYLAYKDLPTLFQNGANDGFHEAIGDAVALSMTPKYLVDLGLFAKAPSDDKAVINEQMRRALDKISFLPFGRLIDQWRWDVFSGKTPPSEWNKHWWDLKRQYQGVMPPAPRSEDDFDPAAKYHVTSSTPYMRYFLAAVLQFQFHRALCEAAGEKGPLHTCSVYGNKEAGKRLEALLESGASKPWPDALEAMTGKREMDASAILDYFAPLSAWLDEQNKGQKCGW